MKSYATWLNEMISPKAHDYLTMDGWEHQGSGVYLHPSYPGHKIIITGYDPVRGGRQSVAWEHHEDGRNPIKSNGAEQLQYRLSRIKQRASQL